MAAKISDMSMDVNVQLSAFCFFCVASHKDDEPARVLVEGISMCNPCARTYARRIVQGDSNRVRNQLRGMPSG